MFRIIFIRSGSAVFLALSMSIFILSPSAINSALRSFAVRFTANAMSSFPTNWSGGVSKTNFSTYTCSVFEFSGFQTIGMQSVKVNRDLDLSSMLKWYSSFSTVVLNSSFGSRSTNFGMSPTLIICCCKSLLNDKFTNNLRVVFNSSCVNVSNTHTNYYTSFSWGTYLLSSCIVLFLAYKQSHTTNLRS